MDFIAIVLLNLSHFWLKLLIEFQSYYCHHGIYATNHVIALQKSVRTEQLLWDFNTTLKTKLGQYYTLLKA